MRPECFNFYQNNVHQMRQFSFDFWLKSNGSKLTILVHIDLIEIGTFSAHSSMGTGAFWLTLGQKIEDPTGLEWLLLA